MRFLSSILFALMAMVLPMAGVQHHFCTMSMAFVDGEDCPVEEKDCCGEKNAPKPATPDCMISAKLLPNAEKYSPVHVPLAGAWIILPVSTMDIVPAASKEAISPENDRAPPDRPRLYLVQRRLLI